MTTSSGEHTVPARLYEAARTVRDRYAGMQIVSAILRADGEMIDEPAGPGLLPALVGGARCRALLREAVARWSASDECSVIEPAPGLRLVATPLEHRRVRVGYFVAALGDMSFADWPNLDAEARAVGLDPNAVRAEIAGFGPRRDAETLRVHSVASWMYEDLLAIADEEDSIEGFSKQLSGVYEELSLLYKLSSSMTGLVQPDRFVSMAIDDLYETLAYKRVCAAFSTDSSAARLLAGKVLVAGGETLAPQCHERVRDLAESCDPDRPLVFDGPVDCESTLLACISHPISREGKSIGVIMALGKLGDDPEVSSMDMKLLAAAAASIGVLLENAALYADQQAMFLGTLKALTAAIDAKDRYTRGHSERVATMATRLGAAIGLDKATLERLHIAGLVHDVGKIGVPESVLCKPGRLTDEEFGLIKLHPEIGHRILRDIPQLADTLPGVLYHHERWDGRGYPHGVKGDDIPLFARLIAIADSFDAMSSTRTYRQAMPREKVLAEIERCGGTQFDPQLSGFFLDLDFTEYDEMVRRHRAAERLHEAPGSAEGLAA